MTMQDKVCPICGEGSPHVGGHWILNDRMRNWLRSEGLIVGYDIQPVTPERAREIRKKFRLE